MTELWGKISSAVSNLCQLKMRTQSHLSATFIRHETYKIRTLTPSEGVFKMWVKAIKSSTLMFPVRGSVRQWAVHAGYLVWRAGEGHRLRAESCKDTTRSHMIITKPTVSKNTENKIRLFFISRTKLKHFSGKNVNEMKVKTFSQ